MLVFYEFLPRTVGKVSRVSKLISGLGIVVPVSVNGKSIEAFLQHKCGITEMPRFNVALWICPADSLFESVSHGRHDTVLTKS